MKAPILRSLPAVALLLLLAAPVPAAAQFGLKGGVNLSRFVGGDAESDAKAGLNLGASIPILRVGPLAIVPEVFYAKKGGATMDPTLAQTFEFELSYIEVPVLAKLFFPIGAGFQGYVGGGPAYAWNLDCKFTAESDPNAVARTCGEQFQSFDTAMNSADKGIVFNAGIDLPVLGGLGGLNLDARMVRGLDRVIDSSDADKVKNQSITLMLGYSLGR